MKLLPVQPIGSERTLTHLNRGDRPHQWRQMTHDVYPTSPRGTDLRGRRLAARLTLRDAAAVLGIGVVELSKLEFGKLTLSEADWAEAFNAIAVAASAGKGEGHV